tara:strand:+ start:1683 stop:2120 length:438 start_codon:yes stop_codon:yes gene_type:complete
MEITKFDRQLFRRFLASIIDIIIATNLSLLVFLFIKVINFFILNLFYTSYYFIIPVVFSSYFILTLGSKIQATYGMRIMNFNLCLKKGDNFTKKHAFIHSFLFFLILPIGVITLTYFIYPLLNNKRTCIHDLFYKVRFKDLGEIS